MTMRPPACAINTPIWRSGVTICSAMNILFGITQAPFQLFSHNAWFRKGPVRSWSRRIGRHRRRGRCHKMRKTFDILQGCGRTRCPLLNCLPMFHSQAYRRARARRDPTDTLHSGGVHEIRLAGMANPKRSARSGDRVWIIAVCPAPCPAKMRRHRVEGIFVSADREQ